MLIHMQDEFVKLGFIMFDFFMRWGSEQKVTIHILIRDAMLRKRFYSKYRHWAERFRILDPRFRILITGTGVRYFIVYRKYCKYPDRYCGVHRKTEIKVFQMALIIIIFGVCFAEILGGMYL